MRNTNLNISLLGLLLISVGCTQPSRTLVPLNPSILASPPQTVNLQIKNYNPQTGNKFQNIFVSNFSVVAKGGNILYSTARDGLTDVAKTQHSAAYNFGLNSPESAVPGFSDLVLFISGVTAALQTNVVCPGGQMGNLSNDGFTYNDSRFGGALTFLGLRDCDKNYLGISAKTFDSNGNGIPDYFEFRCGLNPINKIQAFTSAASDGVTNLDKCRMNIPITENASNAADQLLAYQYSNGMNSDGSLTFNIKNIPILNGGQDNFIAIYVTETNSNTSTPSLYSAFLILPAGKAGKILQFNYWATASTTLVNQQILVP